MDPGGGPPEELYNTIKPAVDKWRRVIREAKIERAD